MRMETPFSKVSLKSRSMSTKIYPITNEDLSKAGKDQSIPTKKELIRLVKVKIYLTVKSLMRDQLSTIP